MAERPVFFQRFDAIGVKTRSFAFTWSPNLAPSQKRKNVVALYETITANRHGCRPLEISRRSLAHAGKLDEALSNQEAFLRYHPKN